MDSNDTFWLRVIAIGATVLCVMVTSCTYNSIDRREKWAEAVANGNDPMSVACALGSHENTGDYAICTALALSIKSNPALPVPKD